MPSRPQSESSSSGMPRGEALFSPEGREALLAIVEARLSETAGVWRMRLLARDLIDALGPAVESALHDAGIDARLRRVVSVRITRGVREYGSCNIPRGEDGTCRLAFSGLLFFPGNAAALLDVIAHELLHACLPPREGHGGLFHRGMEALNGALGLRVQVYSEKTAIRQTEALYRYKVVCAACGNAFYYLRAGAVVRHPSRYRCAKCGKGAFEVYRLEPVTSDKENIG